MIFEGPGNNPLIFASAANVEEQIESILLAALSNAGQTCLSPKRFYVLPSIGEKQHFSSPAGRRQVTCIVSETDIVLTTDF
ncbi:MAG: aldehyde dehydrogenase family protein [Proteobacteria bacterium]|nr:aldehyde dehydrogenase family protein [Pseudomonadota bacterium]